MRLTEADRESLYEQLASHAAADRLTVEELERRVALVAAAQTREQAVAVLADLPALGEAAKTGSQARPRRRWWRGHGDAERPQIGWQPTGERFRDPRSGWVMRVWVDPGGGRHYVPDE